MPISLPEKLSLMSGPSPIEFMPYLSKLASSHGEVKIFMKRDDLNCGPASGNKARKLEFLLAEAQKRKAQVVLTCGGLQSNHARATAILARQLGMDSILFLKGTPPQKYEGNFLLDQLIGSKIIFVDDEGYENMPSNFQFMVDSLRAEKKVAYAIPEGGSSDIGVCGYVAAMEEIQNQCGQGSLPPHFDSVVCATGSGGTVAGLILGRNLLGLDDGRTQVHSFNVCRTSDYFQSKIIYLMTAAVQHYRWPISFMREDINIIDGYVGQGYAKTHPELMAFILDVAQNEGVFLDPVYTGKALFGLIQELNQAEQRGRRFGKNILFVHTGGFSSLFAYEEDFRAAIVR